MVGSAAEDLDREHVQLMQSLIRYPVLTHRERQVLELLARGASNLQIARRLGVAEGTVKGYTHHLFVKLGVQNRAEAVYESTQRNLL